MSAKQRIKKYAKVLVKILLSGGAIYFVINKIDLYQAWQLVQQAHLGYIAIAVVLFCLSKVVAAFRLKLYFNQLELAFSHSSNLRLYLLGMFYNLFLPGGIGGDGYKVYWLNQQYGTKVKSLIVAMLLDRISGVSALAFLAMLGSFAIPLEIPGKSILLIAGVLLMYPVYFFVQKKSFPGFEKIFIPSAIYSLGVQSIQLGSVLCLLGSLGIFDHLFSYAVIFLVSSVAAALPLTLGGLGAREVVFLYGAEFMNLAADTAVTVSLIFYAMAASVSLLGIYFALMPKRLLSAASASSSLSQKT